MPFNSKGGHTSSSNHLANSFPPHTRGQECMCSQSGKGNSPPLVATYLPLEQKGWALKVNKPDFSFPQLHLLGESWHTHKHIR